MVVGGVARFMGSAVSVRRGTARRAFAVTVESGAGAEPTGSPNAVTLSSLLAIQEADGGAQDDREARQHGEALMDALVALQRGLLGGDGPDLTRLKQLAERPVTASDPQLAGLLRAVRVRAAVELARLESAASR